MKTIFLIDDDADDREIFQIALSELGIKTNYIEAKDGQEALEIMASQGFVIPDFIFLDLNMPKVNGLEFLKKARGLPSYNDVPIFMYSTSSVKQEKDKCLEAGATGFITKHYTINGLLDELKHLLQINI